MKTSEYRMHVAVALLLGGWSLFACKPGEVEEAIATTESVGAALPGAGELSGWEIVSEPEYYGPENLWDYINGQAEFYLNYGFIRVDAAEYRAESGAPSVVVEVYQMASPEEAFGIYAAERNPEDRSIEIGSGGYLGSNVLNFWQGKNYIKQISFEGGTTTEDALVALAREISMLTPTGSGMPELFSYFPEEGRVDASERFFPTSFLGQAGLDRAYRVDYADSSGRPFQLFLCRLETVNEARAALANYAAFLDSQGREVELVAGESATVVSESGMATVVFVQKEFFGGVLGAATLKDGHTAADQLKRDLAHVH